MDDPLSARNRPRARARDGDHRRRLWLGWVDGRPRSDQSRARDAIGHQDLGLVYLVWRHRRQTGGFLTAIRRIPNDCPAEAAAHPCRFRTHASACECRAMNLDLLPIGWVHLGASLLALAAGTLVLARPKG